MITIHIKDGHVTIYSGDIVVAGDFNEDLAKAARWALQITHGDRVALLGLGTGNLLRLLGPYAEVDTYEIEQEIVDWFGGKYPEFDREGFFVGDYRQILEGEYDVIVDDTGVEPPDGLLEKHLAPAGMILSWKNGG